MGSTDSLDSRPYVAGVTTNVIECARELPGTQEFLVRKRQTALLNLEFIDLYS